MSKSMHSPPGSQKSPMYTLYSMQRSGNSYKVRLALAQLGLSYRLEEVDILKGESRTPESNAILWHLASNTRLRPQDRFDRAEALQWMFFEQHSIEPNIGAAYFWLTLVKGGRELQQHALEDWMEEGYRALGVMDRHLKAHRYIVADRYTVADIALYAYTHVAHLCDYDLTMFPAIRNWLERVAAEPGHVPMLKQPADVTSE
jgi:glutathione S-transferase